MATVSLEAYLLHLVRRAERSRTEINRKRSMTSELRALEFWRAIIGECLATTMYVFLVCGSHVAWPLHSVNTLTKSFANGFAAATTAHCFGHVSGCHTNPAITFAALATRRLTPLRAFLYVAAQCGGAIAGAALVYGVTSPADGHQQSVGCTLVSDTMSPWRAMGLEGALSFVVCLTLFSSSDPDRKTLGSDALAIGISYLVCSLIALPATGASMNPARSLGPAFVTNTWTYHWVYWCGPVVGAVMAGLIYEYIFESPKRLPRTTKENFQREVSSAQDDSESKVIPPVPNRVDQIRQVPCFRPIDGPRTPSRGTHTHCGQQLQQSFYCTVPRGSARNATYRTWDNDCGSSTQFKF